MNISKNLIYMQRSNNQKIENFQTRFKHLSIFVLFIKSICMKTYHQNVILKQQIFDQFSRIFFDFHIYSSINKKFSKNAHTYMFKNIFQKSRFCQNIANFHTNHDSKKLKILCLKKSTQKIFVIVLQNCE